MSRRNFLKQIGLATAAIGVAPISHAVAPLKTISNDLKVGLLLPVNNGYTQLAENYLTGFKSKFASQNNWSYQNVHAEYYKISEFRFRQKVESLLTENKVDIVVAHASMNLISAVTDLFDQHKKVLIGTILGEKIPVKFSPSQFVFVNSFNLWQTSWAAGKWAANTIGKKAAIVDSFYDAGFDSGNCFKIGFETRGGTEIKRFMAKMPGENIDPLNVLDDIKTFAPDAIFVNLSGSTAINFLRLLTCSSLNEYAEIIALPFALNEETLPHIGSSVCGVKSFSSWSPGLKTKANIDFLSQLQGSRIENPDVFHLLGYESAQMIAQIHQNRALLSPASMLETMRIESPRGVVEIEPKSHFTQAPCYMRKVDLERFNLVNNVIGEELADISTDDNSIKNDYSGLNSGWINPYLTT
jgi:branched-chain amino acid transport system substrate-binding protein